MQPARRPIRITRGDTYQHYVTMVDADGNPANLAGCTYAAQLRSNPTVTAVLADFTTAVDVEAGAVWVTLDAAVTAGLPPGRRAWDLQETGADGNVTTLVAGPADVLADVTRPVAP